MDKVISIQSSMENTLFSMKSNLDKYNSLKQSDAQRQISAQKLNTCNAFANLFQINDGDVHDGVVNERTKKVIDSFALMIEYTKNIDCKCLYLHN